MFVNENRGKFQVASTKEDEFRLVQVGGMCGLSKERRSVVWVGVRAQIRFEGSRRFSGLGYR